MKRVRFPPPPTHQSTAKKPLKVIGVILGMMVVSVSGFYLVQKYKKSQASSLPTDSAIEDEPLIQLGENHPNSLRFNSAEVHQFLHIETTAALAAGSPVSLILPRTLVPDPDRFIRVNAVINSAIGGKSV